MEQTTELLKAMQEMTARLEAKIVANQARMDANQKMLKMGKRQEEMKAQVGFLACWIDANREEMKSTVNAFEEKMDAWIANMRDD
jgi:hypothetical protein